MLLPGRLASSLSAFQEDQDTVIALWSSDPIGRCRLAQVPPDFVEPPHFPAIQPSDHPILISFVSRSCPDPIRLLSPAIQLPRQAGTFGFFTRSPAGSGDPSSDRPPAVSNPRLLALAGVRLWAGRCWPAAGWTFLTCLGGHVISLVCFRRGGVLLPGQSRRSGSANTSTIPNRACARLQFYAASVVAVGSFRMIPNRPFLLNRLRSGCRGSASQIMD